MDLVTCNPANQNTMVICKSVVTLILETEEEKRGDPTILQAPCAVAF